MDNNTPGVVINNTPKSQSSKGLIAGMLICAAIGIAGAGFGGYMLLKGDNKGTETVKTENSNTTSTTTKTDNTNSSTTTKTEKSPISTTEAEAILENYIGANKIMPIFGFFPEFKQLGFTESLKLQTLFERSDIEGVFSNQTACEEKLQYNCYGETTFDKLNNAYQNLFGDYVELEKKDYDFGTESVDNNGNKMTYYLLRYNEDKDTFVAYGPNGLGGTSPERLIYKVVNVQKDGENVVGQLAFDMVDLSLFSSDHNESLDHAANNLTVYNFVLSPYNNTYVLTDFKKAE